MLKTKGKSKDKSNLPAVTRINVIVIAAGMLMLAVSLVVEYFRLVR